MINTGDTTWVLISSALVMLMTPALGFFYGGLVRKKNVLATLMQSFFALCLISVQWVLWGYSLAFGPDHFGLIGDFSWFGLAHVGFEPNKAYAPTIPHQAFMLFQMMFAIITAAIITGGFAERKRFKAFALFILLWTTFVYDPLAHWVWASGGWLHKLGALDFAGGTVVHISSGMAALVAAMAVGHRLKSKQKMNPHDATLVILGASLLWFGWFGFNAGSALAANALAINAFVVTNTAAAMAALSWMTLSWWQHKQPSVLGIAAGAVAGLVAITPAAGYVNVAGSLLIGMGAGILCFFAVQLKKRLKVDDALDVWAVHGVGGIWGALATGLFATTAVNSAGGNGLFYGNPQQLFIQLVAVAASVIYSFVVTLIILKLVGKFVSLRVNPKEELIGLDVSQHGELAYN